MSDGPDIYGYLDYRRFLRDWFEAKKTANPRFSHRVFARMAGVASPSLLLAVMEGKRNLTPVTIEGFCSALSLSAETMDFFEALVALDQAESHDERNKAWERVRAVRRFREARRLAGEGVEYLSCWYYPAIRELASCDDFRADPDWIATRLRPRVTPAQARKALEVLQTLGLLRPDKSGHLVAADASIVTPHEVAGLAAVNYHLGMIERARDALTTVPADERHYCAVTVAIPMSLVPRLKRELDAFQERLLDLCDASVDPRERVYQLNLQLLPLSAPRTTKE